MLHFLQIILFDIMINTSPEYFKYTQIKIFKDIRAKCFRNQKKLDNIVCVKL